MMANLLDFARRLTRSVKDGLTRVGAKQLTVGDRLFSAFTAPSVAERTTHSRMS